MLSMEPNVGLDPTNPVSWPAPKSTVGCSTDWATQGPAPSLFCSQFSNGTECLGPLQKPCTLLSPISLISSNFSSVSLLSKYGQVLPQKCTPQPPPVSSTKFLWLILPDTTDTRYFFRMKLSQNLLLSHQNPTYFSKSNSKLCLIKPQRSILSLHLL